MNRIVAFAHAYVGMGHNAGAETTLHDILRYLVANGWEAHVIVSQPNPGQTETVIDGVHVHPQADRRTILHWIPQASVVISHLECTERTVVLARKYGVPVVQLIHNDMTPTHGYVAMGCDLALFNTDWVKNRFDFEGLSLTVHPPVDGSRYSILPNASQGCITLVNLWKPKGSEIFYQLAERFPNQKFLGVVGGYGEQDIRSGIDNVSFHSHTHDMSIVYSRTKIVLMPSKYESYGRVAVEAASLGIPSIVADTPGLREALGDSGTFCSGIDEYTVALKKMLHWKALASAGKAASARFKEISSQTDSEMSAMLVYMNGLATTSRLLRGF
jgi:glycosyltransferase involved in cell wall biosynthesis